MDIDEEQHNECESMNNHKELQNNNVHQVHAKKESKNKLQLC